MTQIDPDCDLLRFASCRVNNNTEIYFEDKTKSILNVSGTKYH
jgi:hypothetical protein